jgi:hypothetical protein
MKLSLAFIATVSATQITFKPPAGAASVGDCELVYAGNELTLSSNCVLSANKANVAAVDSHKNQMTAVVQSIANTVCPHHIEISQESHMDGTNYGHYDGWTNHSVHGDSFCRFDCKTGHYSPQDGECQQCVTSCSTGYTITGTCGGDSNYECEQDESFCSTSSLDFPGANQNGQEVNKPYGSKVSITCAAGYHAVGSPEMLCGSDGQFRAVGRCISKVDVVRETAVSSSCATSLKVTCPAGYTAVGGGIKNDLFGDADASVLAQSYPVVVGGGSSVAWSCRMQSASDCQNYACHVACVPSADVDVSIKSTKFNKNLHQRHTTETTDYGTSDFAQDGVVTVGCDDGWTVSGVGMVNHKYAKGYHNHEERNFFQEMSYVGNTASCNMGERAAQFFQDHHYGDAEFTCYAACVRATSAADGTNRDFTCETIENEGDYPKATCTREYDRVVGGGMKQTKKFDASSGDETNFGEISLTSSTEVTCNSGLKSGFGNAKCQARCCHMQHQN